MSRAELKYDLALHPTVVDKKVQPQAWYKERLRTKQIKTLKTTDTARSLVGKNWMFIKGGLDDFRDGLPPQGNKEIFLKGAKGPGPNIMGSDQDLANIKQPAVRRRFDKQQICYSRITPLQQQKREHIEEVEFGLLQHPLALYPHLEESVPEDLFDEIVDIIEPEMHMASDDEEETESPISTPVPTEPAAKPTDNAESQDNKREEIMRLIQGEEGMVRNPYRWLPRKEERDKKDKKKTTDKRSHSPSQEEHIKMVTKEFCDWVANLGGESNNIEESTITSLFASGYETKPALSVPIHVVELTNVPPELRFSANVQPLRSSEKAQPEEAQKPPRWTSTGAYEPSWVKFKYGAWYLSPNSWKKRDAEEPLKDPKELKEHEMTEAKRRSHVLNLELASMHGSKAFMDFIDKKGTRKPEFLEEVAEIQRLTAEEEQRKLLAEQTAKNKRSMTARAEKSSSKRL